ncbi:MAG: hypothetical protein U0587_05450 [Candidatus Binatia bacterium]
MDFRKGNPTMRETASRHHQVLPRAAGLRTVGCVLVGAFVLAASGVAYAQNSCNGALAIDYTVVQSPNLQGSVDTVQLTIGASTIQGGTQITINQVFFDLDCDVSSLPGCTDQGAIIRYQGDATITTDCSGISFASNLAAGGTSPNEVVFSLSPALVIPAGSTNFCHVQFQIRKETGSNPDVTPYVVEERAGFPSGQANCDNGLSALNIGTSSLSVATPTATPSPTETPTPTPTPTPTDTPTPTPSRTPTPTPTITNTPTQTPRPTNTPPPVPVVPSPTSPTGLLLISGLGISIAWMLRQMGQQRLSR